MKERATVEMIGQAWLKGRLKYLSGEDDTGEAVGYYESGSTWFRYPLLNGEIHGTGRIWYDNGRLQCEEHCYVGALHGPSHYWYPNGVMDKERHYRRGVLHGTQKEWHINGCLQAQRFFVNDVLHGTVTNWYPNGHLRSQMNYVHGRLHGVHKIFDMDGLLRTKEIYVRGVKMPVLKYEKLLNGHLSAKDILAVRNAAVRRIFLEEFGYARFLAQMPHEIIHRDGEQELVKINWLPREEAIVLVKVKCPTTGAFYTLRVPPAMETVKDAVAWTFGFPESEYQPVKET